MSSKFFYIGLMSGTSLDGVDGVLIAFDTVDTDDTDNIIATDAPLEMLSSAYSAFPDTLRTDLLALQASGDNEIHREALAANQLAILYAECVRQLLQQASLPASAIRAIGCHGQTIRHCPHLGYTRQTNNPALLAELTGIDVIADFRSRDVAAGGQGAPLVPAFHSAVFAKERAIRVVANIGGMTNISILNGAGNAIGFDTGPGNVLMDAWITRHLGQAYDARGNWAAGGRILPALLKELQSEAFFAMAPPKSTGRDLFDAKWLANRLQAFADAAPADVQATLTALTAHTLADAISAYANDAEAIFVCGGGAYNDELLRQLKQALAERGVGASLASTAALGVSPNHVEALAFAWLAQRFGSRAPGNLPAVTGARGLRVLGALYPR